MPPKARSTRSRRAPDADAPDAPAPKNAEKKKPAAAASAKAKPSKPEKTVPARGKKRPSPAAEDEEDGSGNEDEMEEPASKRAKVSATKSRARPAAPKPAPAAKAAKPAPAKKSAAPKKAARAAAPREMVNQRPEQALEVFVFGTGGSGELGLGPTKRGPLKNPTRSTKPRHNDLLGAEAVGVVELSVGGMHCAALTKKGAVYTWGVNDNYALGRETAWSPPDEGDSEDEDEIMLNPHESTPTRVVIEDEDGEEVDVAQVETTDNATFALATDGTVYGWGTFLDSNGIFGFFKHRVKDTGRKIKEERAEPRPVLIPGLRNIKYLVGGSNHMMAMAHNGAVYAWGSGEQHELGRRILPRTMWDQLAPTELFSPRKKIVSLFSNFHTSFAVNDRGHVYAWGLNNYGQTGIPFNPGRPESASIISPTRIKALEQYKFEQIEPGFHHTIARTKDGGVYVWGRCDDSQLGMDASSLPQDLVELDIKGRPSRAEISHKIPDLTATDVAAGIDCCMALTPDGDIYAWGFSEQYRTGLATEDTVDRPKLLESKHIDEKVKKLAFAGFGGQFSVVAGVPK